MKFPVATAAVAATVALAGCSQGGDTVEAAVAQLARGDGRICQNQAVIDTIDSIVDVRETVWNAFRYREPFIRDQWERFLGSYKAEWSLLTLKAVDTGTRTATCAGIYGGRFEGSDGYETTQPVTYTVTATVDGKDFVVEVDPGVIRNVIHRSAADFIDAIPEEGEESPDSTVAMLPETAVGDEVPATLAAAPAASDMAAPVAQPAPEPPAVKEDRIETVGPPPSLSDPGKPRPLSY